MLISQCAHSRTRAGLRRRASSAVCHVSSRTSRYGARKLHAPGCLNVRWSEQSHGKCSQEFVNAARLCNHTVSSTSPADSRGSYYFANALDGYHNVRSFWMSAAGVDNVVVDVDLGTRFSLERIELHWRSNFSVRPRLLHCVLPL